MKNKTDQRSKYTQSLIKNGLIELLKEEDLNKITVTKLCQASNISRGTFYNQYFDVYDVYESLEEEFFSLIKAKVETNKVYFLNQAFFRDIIYLLLRNFDWVSIIFQKKENNKIIDTIINYIREKATQEYIERYPLVAPSKISQILTYSITGSLAIISNWINNGAQDTPESIADLINEFNAVIVKYFFKP